MIDLTQYNFKLENVGKHWALSLIGVAIILGAFYQQITAGTAADWLHTLGAISAGISLLFLGKKKDACPVQPNQPAEQ